MSCILNCMCISVGYQCNMGDIYHLIWAGQSLHFQGFRAVSAQMAVVFCLLRSSSSLVFRFGKTEQANGKGRLHSIKHNKEYVTSTVFQLL